MRGVGPVAAGRMRTVLQVAATYVGTVVGAGFASGQEALRFFAAHGRGGLWGLLLATGLLSAYGVLIMDLGRRLGARSHRELLHHACGRRLGPWADAAVTAFLLAILCVMLAGAGAVAAEQWHLPPWAGALATALLTVTTVLAGLRGLVTANGVVVPLLALLVTGLGLYSISRHGVRFGPGAPAMAASPHWFLSAWLYAGYNLVLSTGVLAPLGAAVAHRGTLVVGGVLGGAGLGALALALYLALGAHPEAGRFQVPMLYLARFHPLPIQILYSLILWAEIYTTASASAFSVARRLAAGRPGDAPFRAAALAAVAAALLGAPLGFSRLVGTLYPALGVGSAAVLLLLTVRSARRT